MTTHLTIGTAGSFPITFSKCLKELSVSGSASGSSVLSKLLSFRNPTQLFQLFLGDGQHAFSAHGMLDLPPLKNKLDSKLIDANRRARGLFADKRGCLSQGR